MCLHLPKFQLFFLIVLVGITGHVQANNVTVQVGGTMPGGGAYGGGTSPKLAFSPTPLTINVGDTVTFTNLGGTIAAHNVHADDNSFRCANGCDGDGTGGNGNPSSSNWSFTLTFTTPGTVKYHCDNHVSMGMVGNIIVNAVTPPPFVIGGYMSGNWYRAPDPDGSHGQGGHGFQLEFTNLNNGALAIWFVYAPVGDSSQILGSQNWIYAQGSYDPTSNTVTLPAIRLTGAKFPPNFNPADVKGAPPDPLWGSLTFTFSDCNHGTASWNSTMTGYGNGSLPITRLTQIAGTTCP